MAAIATIEPANLTIDPGASATILVRIRNGGAIVDRFDVTVVGPLAAWARAEPASLSLFPGQEGEARVVFAPPREPFPRAGTLPFAVRVAPGADSAGSTVEEGRITVGAFHDLAAEIVPQTSRASRVGRHDVLVENRGNAPVEIAVGASDPDRLVAFEIEPERLLVGPGERAGVRVRAAARDTFLLGARQSHPFAVEVRAGKQPPIALRGTLLQGPLLPGWLLPVGGIAVAAVVALVALPLLTGGGSPRSGAATTASPSPVATATGSPASTAPASGLPSESVPPSASPTPGPFAVSLPLAGVQPMSGALRLRCPDGDEDCRARARDTLQLFINALAARYDGYGIANPADPDVPNTLPVLLSRSTPFAWRSDTGATGTSSRLLVDLAPLIADTPSYAYAVVETGDGTTQRFVVSHATARQLFDTLFEPVPQVDLPEWSLPDKPEVGQVYLWNNAFYDNLFVRLSPAP